MPSSARQTHAVHQPGVVRDRQGCDHRSQRTDQCTADKSAFRRVAWDLGQRTPGDFFTKMRQLMEFASELSSSLKGESSEKPDLDGALVPLFKALLLRARL